MRKSAAITSGILAACAVYSGPTILDWRLAAPITLLLLLSAAFVGLLARLGWEVGLTATVVSAAGLSAAVGAVGVVMGQPLLVPLVSGVAALMLSVLGPERHRTGHTLLTTLRQTRTSEFFGITLASVATIGAWSILLARNSSPLNAPTTAVGADGPLLASIARSLVDNGLSSAPFLSGSPLRYHWFAYGLGGWLADLSGASYLTTVMFVVPGLAFFGTILAAGALGRAVSASPAAFVLSVTATTLVGFVGVWRFAQSSIWEWGSPSTLVGGYYGVVVTLLVILQWKRPHWTFVLLIGVNAFLATVSKSSMGAVLAATCLVYVPLRALSQRRLPDARELIGTAAILLAVVASFLLFLSGTGNDLHLDPFWGTGDYSSPRDFISAVTVQVAYVAAACVGWAGLLTAWAVRSLGKPPYLWAASAAMAGSIAFLLLSAPDDNDRFFAIAAAVLVIPISTLALLDVKTAFGLPSGRAVAVAAIAVALAGVLLGWASWQPTFDLRPWLLPTVLATVGVGIGALLAAGAPRGLGIRSIAGFTGVVLVSLAVLVPQTFRIFQTGYVNTAAGYSPLSLPGPEASPFSDSEIQAALRAVREEGQSPGQIAISGGPTAPGQIYRWIIFESGSEAYVVPDGDLNRLTDVTATTTWDARKEIVRSALAGSADAVSTLCTAGVSEVWQVDESWPPDPASWVLLFAGPSIQVSAPRCA